MVPLRIRLAQWWPRLGPGEPRPGAQGLPSLVVFLPGACSRLCGLLSAHLHPVCRQRPRFHSAYSSARRCTHARARSSLGFSPPLLASRLPVPILPGYLTWVRHLLTPQSICSASAYAPRETSASVSLHSLRSSYHLLPSPLRALRRTTYLPPSAHGNLHRIV
jgi:hypothetical protein